MKKVILSMLVMLFALTTGSAQRLVIGEKAPELRISQWLEGRSAPLGKAVLIAFFHSSSDQCVRDLAKLNEITQTYPNLNGVVVTREPFDKVTPHTQGYRFYVGKDDEGKTFSAYGVRFVPFNVLLDARGRLVWTGNLSNLTGETLSRALR